MLKRKTRERALNYSDFVFCSLQFSVKQQKTWSFFAARELIKKLFFAREFIIKVSQNPLAAQKIERGEKVSRSWLKPMLINTFKA